MRRPKCKNGHAAYFDGSCENRYCEHFIGNFVNVQHQCPWCVGPVYDTGKCDDEDCPNYTDE